MSSAKKTAVDFDEIIQADRQRRKNEALAQEIFGKGRRASAPGAGLGSRKPGTGPSLASRIGINKQRSASNTRLSAIAKPKRNPPPAGNVNAEWTHDLFSATSGASPRLQPNQHSRVARTPKEVRLYSAINTAASSPALNNQFNIVGSSKSISGITIRGLAGPCVVVAENFAPGTTAADIESAMAPYGGPILKCRLLPSTRTVIAELVFDTREGADKVIEQFNNQTADGLILRLYHKSGPAANASPPTVFSTAPKGPRADLVKEMNSNASSSARYAAPDHYEPRDSNRDSRYESDDIVDGSYGFDDKMDTDDADDRQRANGRGRGGLYSDNMVGRRGDRGRGRRGDSRDRGRGGDRGRSFR